MSLPLVPVLVLFQACPREQIRMPRDLSDVIMQDEPHGWTGIYAHNVHVLVLVDANKQESRTNVYDPSCPRIHHSR